MFRLAHGRGDRFLWEALRHDPAMAETRKILDDLRGQVDFLRPFELIERVLTRHDGRRRIQARFGAEVDEALEAFVDLALTYEQGHIPSLDGFLGWLEASDAEVKRQTESAGQRVRVMTVHGAKGLEAPIVILPDTAARGAPTPAAMAQVDGVPILRTLKANATQTQLDADAAVAELRDEESDRLLYVALTRAESWLIVAGAGKVEDPTSWYARVALGVEDMGHMPHDSPLGDGLRHEHGQWPDAQPPTDVSKKEPTLALVLPDVPKMPDAVKPVSPSALGGAKALPGEGADTETALARGQMIHHLLEVLPQIEAEGRDAQARRLLQGSGPADEVQLCIAEALSVLQTPSLSGILGDDALAEVSITGECRNRQMWGIIDRLLIDDQRVLAIDFKSNRVVPQSIDTVPEGLLRQMGAYAHLLAALYPGRRIETALLWTAEARLMPLPADCVNDALARATLDPEHPPS